MGEHGPLELGIIIPAAFFIGIALLVVGFIAGCLCGC